MLHLVSSSFVQLSYRWPSTFIGNLPGPASVEVQPSPRNGSIDAPRVYRIPQSGRFLCYVGVRIAMAPRRSPQPDSLYILRGGHCKKTIH